jgi:hypothetical protein
MAAFCPIPEHINFQYQLACSAFRSARNLLFFVAFGIGVSLFNLIYPRIASLSEERKRDLFVLHRRVRKSRFIRIFQIL